MPAGIHPGFYRYAAIAAFNRVACGHEPPPPPGPPPPLSAIAHHPRLNEHGQPKFYTTADEVIDTLATTNWLQVFGLNYLETMRLPFSEWRKMRARVRPHSPPPAP